MKLTYVYMIWLMGSVATFAQSASGAIKADDYNLTDEGVAIQGYDPVSYFMEKEPQHGTAGISYTYKGATYYFTNGENKAAFTQNPDKYEPAYGGWCAYAMGDDGSKVKIDPGTYKIINGKMYLFYHTFWVNTLSKWNKKENQLKLKADKNWQALSTNQ